MRITEADIDRFWKKTSIVDGDGCWEWAAATDGHGYGVFQLDGRATSAHRVSWEIENGPIPIGNGYHGTCVLHRCDNPKCVRPSHLFLGTAADNAHDRDGKDRTAHNVGSSAGGAKLTDEDVLEIRRLHASGITHAEISRRYGIQHVSSIISGKRWGHIGDVSEYDPSTGKLRRARGEGSGRHKLSETDIINIRNEYSLGSTKQSTLATRYGVTQSLISKIVRGEIWKHLD